VKPDFLLLDYSMPEMNGLEAARMLSALVPECAILMFAAFATPHLTELAKAAGVRAVLSKDVNGIRSVIEAIEVIASISLGTSNASLSSLATQNPLGGMSERQSVN